MQIEIEELLTTGKMRWKWPWDSLKAVGDYFIVTEPKNVKNGRQSVHQANLRYGAGTFKGGLVDVGFKVTRMVEDL